MDKKKRNVRSSIRLTFMTESSVTEFSFIAVLVKCHNNKIPTAMFYKTTDTKQYYI